MPIVTRKSSLAFPEIARIRKGTKKQQRTSQSGRSYETFGADLKDKFRIDWLPGNEKTQAMFGNDIVGHLVVTLAFNEIDMVWDNWYEAYTAGRMVARADGEKFIYLVDTETGEVVVRDGKPYKEFDRDIPVGYYAKSNGQKEPIFAKEHGRLRVVVPALRRMAYFTLVTTSATDCRLITEQLSALSDFAKRYKFQLAGVPLVLRRRPYQISYKDPSGQVKRVEKYLVNIEADPDWVQRMTDHMKYMSLPGDAPMLALASGETLKGMPEDYNIAEPEEDDEVEDIPDGEWVETDVINDTPAPLPVPIARRDQLSPKKIKEFLEKKAEGANANRTANDKQVSLLAATLNLCFAGQKNSDDIRHSVVKYLTGETSLKNVSDPMIVSMLDWLKPEKDSGGAYYPDEVAAEEARLIWRETLIESGQEELFS